PVDRRRARHVRHVRDSNRPARTSFHKLQGLLWKCGKLNFCKLRPFPLSDLLRKDLSSPRFLSAPRTERKYVEAGSEASRRKPKVSGAGGRKRNRLGELKGRPPGRPLSVSGRPSAGLFRAQTLAGFRRRGLHAPGDATVGIRGFCSPRRVRATSTKLGPCSGTVCSFGSPSSSGSR